LKFVDDEDRFTSFLFNFLEKSISIRASSELLIAYDKAVPKNWIGWT
jgi:predicted DNA binding CopG/RHH family protein